MLSAPLPSFAAMVSFLITKIESIHPAKPAVHLCSSVGSSRVANAAAGLAQTAMDIAVSPYWAVI